MLIILPTNYNINYLSKDMSLQFQGALLYNNKLKVRIKAFDTSFADDLQKAIENIEAILLRAKIYEANFNTSAEHIGGGANIEIKISVDEKYNPKMLKAFEITNTGEFLDHIPSGFGQAYTVAARGFINPLYFHEYTESGVAVKELEAA